MSDKAELELEDSGTSLLSASPGLQQEGVSPISEGRVIMAFNDAEEIHTPRGIEDIRKTRKAKGHHEDSTQ